MEGGAQLRVVAPDVVSDLRAAAEAGRIAWERRRYRRGDIGDAHLVIAATADAGINAEVAADADAAGRLVVRVDDAEGGSAAFMGAVRRDPLVIGVSTSGAAPGLARLLRAELEGRYGPEHGQLAALWGELRADERVVEALATLDGYTRQGRWRALYRADILGLIRAGMLAEAKKAALACLLSSSD
jgi:siroheme synthase-like protein